MTAVARAFRRQEKSGRGRENITCSHTGRAKHTGHMTPDLISFRLLLHLPYALHFLETDTSPFTGHMSPDLKQVQQLCCRSLLGLILQVCC